MTSIARASYEGWASWESYNLGLLTFDFSTFDGADVFGDSPLDVTFTGPYDELDARERDWPTAFERIVVERGRDSTFETMIAGSATVDLRDPRGLLNPENATSPLYGIIEDRLHPIKLQARRGTIRPLFGGWVRRVVWEPQGRRGTAQLECVDLFYWLRRVRPIIASTGTTTVGAALGLILDATGLTDPNLRDLDTGEQIADFSADGSLTGLELVEELLEVERGLVFVAGSGAFTFRDRYHRLTAAVAGTVADEMKAIGPGVDFDAAISRATVKRTQNGYVAVAESANDVIGRIGYNEQPQIETGYLLSDAAADALADWILFLGDRPQTAVYGLDLDGRTSALLDQILDRDLAHKVAASAAGGALGGNFLIEHVTHTIGERQHSCRWLLSREPDVSPIVFDSSTFDGADVFV